MQLLKRLSFRSLIPLLVMGLFVGAGYYIIQSQAATPDSVQPAAQVPAVKPNSCPPLPAFPDEKCTGVPTGITLKKCQFTNIPDSVYDSCEFDGTLWVTAPDITITNSKINGVLMGDGVVRLNLQLVDVEIDGKSSVYDGIQDIAGYSCTRCHVHDTAKGFSGSAFTIIDSYVHSLYGSRGSYNQAVLGSKGDIVIRHSKLIGNWNKNRQLGTMSAAVSFYTHGAHWPALSNVLFEQNYLETVDGPCLYAGDDSGPGALHQVSNAVFRDNIFYISPEGYKKCGQKGPVAAFYKGNGNVWQNNKFSDGTPINL